MQLPIEQISKELGISVNHINKNLILSKDNVKVEYEIGTKNVMINGSKKILATKSQFKNNVIYGEMNLIAKEFGYILNFDTMSGKIEFLK